MYPRVETIVVPNNVKAEYIGKYVTAKASEILTAIDRGSIVPRSASLRPLEARLFTLSYDSLSAYTLPKELDLLSPDRGELPEVGGDALAKGNQESIVASLKRSGARR